MEVPLARGLATRTTNWTEPVAPAARLPGDQVTTPLASVPPAVAETKVVLAGTVSVRTTPVALALPVLRSEEHTSELQSRLHLVCRLLLEKKKKEHPRTNQTTTNERD